MKRQFLILYREFLFRVLDIEMLAARGDVSQLLGQLAALLAGFSFMQGINALFLTPAGMPAGAFVTIVWDREHSLIATTMLVCGLMAVLSWESAFPDKRDVLVLSPLPVKAGTMFLAKGAALGTALLLTVAALNSFTGLTWPWVFAGSSGGMRALFAYWVTVLAAGAFIYFSVLAVQGLAAQLPRRYYLLLSAWLQVGSFALLLGVRFLQPSVAAPRALLSAVDRGTLDWLPSYWFFGLFHVLNGTAATSQQFWLATRAMNGLAVAGAAAGVAFLLSYLRTLKRIAEEPDILPGARGTDWLGRLGSPLETAFAFFSVRALLRSRQHRVVLAFYLGAGFAISSLFLQAYTVRGRSEDPIGVPVVVSLVMLCFSIVGVRVVSSMPVELRANWIFKVTPVPEAAGCYSAIRRSIFLLSVVPVWLASVPVFFSIWSASRATAHLAALWLLGNILIEVSLLRAQKIPFACSFLAGKTKSQQMMVGTLVALFLIVLSAQYEARLLLSGYWTVALLAALVCGAAFVRFQIAPADWAETSLRFEEQPNLAVVPLDLHVDGGPVVAE